MIQSIVLRDDIRNCHSLFLQLRPHLTNEEIFIKQVTRQLKQGYHLLAYRENLQNRALIGYRFFECLAWGNILYIDDLITDEKARGKGYATKLLEYIFKIAKEKGCKQIHLDSGPHRHTAHKFYLNQGFKIIAYHFSYE